MDEQPASSRAGDVPAAQPEGGQPVDNAHPPHAKLNSHSDADGSNQNQKAATPSDHDLVNTLWSMKEEIARIESHLNRSKESSGLPPLQQQPPPEISEEMRQYHRREEYLYRHRKEWEKDPYEKIQMTTESMDTGYGRTWGPWSIRWGFPEHSRSAQYKRPDPFILPNDDRISESDKLEDQNSPDDFDRHVDYGNRRDWLRKTFEWEMDRLWLAEETELRRRKRLDDAKRKKEKEEQMKANALRATVWQRHSASIDATELNRVDWFSFKTLATPDQSRTHIIDVLIGDPIIDEDKTSGRWWDHLLFGRKPPPAKMAAQPAPTHSKQAVTLPPGHAQLPERIRIHSASLLTILGTILGGKQLVTSDGAGMVLFRPFKTLVYCESALREWCQTLEAKLLETKSGVNVAEQDPGTVLISTETSTTLADGSVPEPAASSERDTQNIGNNDSNSGKADAHDHSVKEQTNTLALEGLVMGKPTTDLGTGATEDDNKVVDKGDQENADDITQSDTALIHIRCLLNFIDTDIGSRRSRIQEPNCRKVFFSDLWHVFRPGVEVIGHDGKQAYRVVYVTTAKHGAGSVYDTWFDGPRFKKKKKRDDNDDDDDRKTGDLSLTCVYIDFDGQHVGPVLETFEFKRYDGQKDVASFDVYPLRYHPVVRGELNSDEELGSQEENLSDSEWLRQKLIRRGTMFLDVAGVKHMYYSGPTLAVREEVESQVVVDFETAISAQESEDTIQRPQLEILAGHDWSYNKGDDHVGDCNTCCADDAVFHDGFIDEKQTKEYIEHFLPKQGAQQAPSVAIIPRLLKDLRASGSANGYSVSDDELLIMSNRVFGFVLRSRKWATLDLTYLTDVRPSAHLGTHLTDPSFVPVDGDQSRGGGSGAESLNAFDRLVLPEGHKPMIKSLIAQHFRDKESKGAHTEQADIVRGKGKGLIMLLHGAPGVGKTSTAEGVAELFKKPLFQITCGDLGTTAKEVEKALEVNFALASRWGCILLLDEADVFLAERTKEDFKRNGLVAVFLRVLEYYSGILFLTTNRVGDFDEAFTSRIHISLYYPELNEKNTLDVFQMNLELIKERFARQKRSIDIDVWGISNFATKHFNKYLGARWNGRQIRNACQTALALAEFEAQGSSHETVLRPGAIVKLTVGHFETVRDAYLEFTKYMTVLYGSSATRRAKEGRLRAMLLDEKGGDAGLEGGKDFLQAAQTPLRGGSPGRGQPSHYSQFDQSPQQRPTPNRQGYSHQQQQSYHHSLSPGFPPQHQQPLHSSTSTPQTYHQQREAAQHQQSQDPIDPRQRYPGAVRHDRHPSQAHSSARERDVPEPEGAGPGQYRQADVHSAGDFGDGFSPPSFGQRPQTQDFWRQASQEEDQGAGSYQ